MVAVERLGNIAVVTVSNPPVNAVSGELAAALFSTIQGLIEDSSVAGIVLIGAGGNFIAGADLKMLYSVVSGTLLLPDLNSFLFAIESSPKPIVAAIHGAALGGGLETAMAAHYRLASPDSSFGQPEVKLGLIPGMGGTQRLPRLVGVSKALEMCVSGEPLDCASALESGLIDQIVSGDLISAAVAFLSTSPPPKPTRAQEAALRLGVPTACSDELHPDLLAYWRVRAETSRRGEQAPLLAIEAIRAALDSTFDEGFAVEQRLFAECLRSPQARALLHVFFAERTVAKVPDLRGHAPAKTIRRAAVLGAGFMGAGISMAFANAGIPVRLSDVSDRAMERALSTIRSKCVNHRLVDVRPGFEEFDAADIIIEAVVEELSVKQKALSQMATLANSGCVLASNTSTLDLDEIASATAHPERVVGLHFFSPAHIMRLVEVIPGKHTSDETVTSAMALGKRLGKVAVFSRNRFGFIGNRMVLPYLHEAHELVAEGVTVQQVNRALYNFGMRMGPLAMEDLVGLDVTWHMRQEASRRGFLPRSGNELADSLYRDGCYGQKTGVGWSLYESDRRPTPNPRWASLAQNRHTELSDQEVALRCLNALISEGRALLAEGVALRALDVDVVYVNGFGFPGWRGGPLYWAENDGTIS